MTAASDQAAHGDVNETTGSPADPRDTSLPALREDVTLSPGGRGVGGAPHWLLHDPACGSYYQLGWREFEIMARWSLAEANTIAAAASRETVLAVSADDVKALADFLEQNGLTRSSARALLARRTHRGSILASVGARLAEAVLFRKVPLLRPQMLLRWLAPFAAPLYTRGFAIAVAISLTFGLYLMGRQWSVFVDSLSGIHSLEGMVGIALALTLAKSLHELSHACSAWRHGVDVPSMGVSLILFWPVLYTDTSGAWLLTDRRARLEIALAGVVAEMVLAILALLAWSFLGDGALRDTAAFAATALIVMSVLVNANPLMRFDGYYALCEIAGIDNLQPRAIALVQWLLRRIIAGSRAANPETALTERARIGLMAYGFALIGYRVVLFGGIAWAVYTLAFPAIGLPLALVMLASFLVLPASREVATWFRLAMSHHGRAWGALRVTVILGLVALPCIVPWRSSVLLSAMHHGGLAQSLYAPEPAQIVATTLAPDRNVAFGEALVQLKVPELERRLAVARLRAETLSRLTARQLTDEESHESASARLSELTRIRSEIAGYEARLLRLTLRAPLSGIVKFVDDGAMAGAWIDEHRVLAQVVRVAEARVVAYAEERDIAAIVPGASATLWLEGLPDVTVPLTVAAVAREPVETLDEPLLATQNGGLIAARPAADGRLLPETAVYRVTFTLTDSGPAGLGPISTRGYVRVETAPRSLASRLWQRVLGVWRRELG